MAGLKDTWKSTGKGLGHAFRDLGKAVVHTVSLGAKKADSWANPDEQEDSKAPEAAAPAEKKDDEA